MSTLRELTIPSKCVLVFALTTAAGCGSPSQSPRAATDLRPQSQPRTAESPSRDTHDLAADERLGGHTLQRHVGRSDAQLVDRLRRERDISAASTYTDKRTADAVVTAALADSKSRVDAWLERRGSRPSLVLHFTERNGPPIGRSLERGARAAVPCHRALVVLRWNDRQQSWYVLTSYPEADR